jgi:flagellar protein FlgJ
VSPLSIPPIAVPGLDQTIDRVPQPDKKIEQTAQEFEAVLLTQVLKGLRRTVPGAEDKPATGGIYEELFDEQLAIDLTKKGGIGIARIIRTYLEQQGQAPAAGAQATKGPKS